VRPLDKAACVASRNLLRTALSPLPVTLLLLACADLRIANVHVSDAAGGLSLAEQLDERSIRAQLSSSGQVLSRPIISSPAAACCRMALRDMMTNTFSVQQRLHQR